MTEKSSPAIARMVPPFSEYGLKRRSVAIEISTRNGKGMKLVQVRLSLRLGNRDGALPPLLNTCNGRDSKCIV
jgi:hypothetical protein